MTQITIDGVIIGTGYPPYVIAELSGNHNGDISKAFKIMEMSKSAGASAVKLQTYRPDTITIDSDLEDFQLTEGLWAGKSLWELYDLAHTPWEWHKPIFNYARQLGITVFSSPFDHTAVDLLEDLGAPAYKIASFEAIDLPLIKYVAKTKKPMIISTGMADFEEISDAVSTARAAGCNELALLHCVSAYPAQASDYNLNTMVDMRDKFEVVIGLSDHTIDNTTAIASIALGSSIIEKHVTLDRLGGGPDDSFSLEPEELTHLCTSVNSAWHSCGKVEYGIKSSERGNIKFRRSLYFVRSLKAGDIITTDDVRSVRPGYGASPKFLDNVIGARVTKDIVCPSPVNLSDLERD